MESSHTNGTETTTLDAYLERAPQEQEFIYYLVVPRRDFAEQSPYYEGFKKRGYEVRLVCYIMRIALTLHEGVVLVLLAR